MEVYLVGGAVRDELLGIDIGERDWCVVGLTPDEMLQRGFRQVGKDFPVFLHPESGEEYALARTERKTGPGYHGFSFNTDTSVTIEQDLKRRDLTINAMARDPGGELIDPYGGSGDIARKRLRHVSDAFVEDPVRILRVARFAARFAHLGFSVAPETDELMRKLVEDGEVENLVADRVWKETERALLEQSPQVYFDVLRQCGALAVVFPEVDALFGVPQPEKWHPEIDCGIHTLLVLEQAARISADGDVRFAGLVHDLGKATTPRERLPGHPGHEDRSVRLIAKMTHRLPVPKAWAELATIVAKFHTHCHRAFELKASTVLRVLEQTDAFRRPGRFEKFLLCCEADARGRTGLEDRDYDQVNYLRGAQKVASEIETGDLTDSDKQGADIGKAIRARRLSALSAFRDDYAPPK